MLLSVILLSSILNRYKKVYQRLNISLPCMWKSFKINRIMKLKLSLIQNSNGRRRENEGREERKGTRYIKTSMRWWMSWWNHYLYFVCFGFYYHPLECIDIVIVVSFQRRRFREKDERAESTTWYETRIIIVVLPEEMVLSILSYGTIEDIQNTRIWQTEKVKECTTTRSKLEAAKNVTSTQWNGFKNTLEILSLKLTPSMKRMEKDFQVAAQVIDTIRFHFYIDKLL